MNPITLLHNAARSYCINHALEWRERNAQLLKDDECRKSIFPRYLILETILAEVEGFAPDNFESEQQIRALLQAAGDTAVSIFTHFKDQVSIASAEDERLKFKSFIKATSLEECAALPQLPYRRVLSDIEHKNLYETFVAHCGQWYGGYTNISTDALPLSLHFTLP